MFIEQAIARLRDQDDSALEDILRFYGPGLERMLRLRFGRIIRNDVDDILSKTMERAWRASARAKPDGKMFGAWLSRIARNIAIDAIRKRNRRPAELVLDDAGLLYALSCPQQPELPETAREISPAVRCLKKSLSGMTEADQKILAAWADANGEGPWAKAVARELGIPTATVRVRRMRLVRRVIKEINGITQSEENNGDQRLPKQEDGRDHSRRP